MFFHFYMISCSVLVAGIVCNAPGGRHILKHPGQLVGNCRIGVRIQMTIGSKGCLYFFMPRSGWQSMDGTAERHRRQ